MEKTNCHFPLSIAPMMGYTDRHYRYLARLICPSVTLYTEMVVVDAIIHGASRCLDFHQSEHPVVLQLGGSDPKQCAIAAKKGIDAGFDAINLNVGCPSPRVCAGAFGARLMRQPKQVADCILAMREVTTCDISVKTRLGVDHDDSMQFLCDFTDTVHAAGCSALILHARKAWLNGLSPKQNRNIPPLDYGRVHQIKKRYNTMPTILNGGIQNVAQIIEHAPFVDGIMVGRAAYDNPWLMQSASLALKGQAPSVPSIETRLSLLEAYGHYMRRQHQRGSAWRAMARHLIHYFDGLPGAKSWRRFLSTSSYTDPDVLLRQAACFAK